MWNDTHITILVTRTLLQNWQFSTQNFCEFKSFKNTILCTVLLRSFKVFDTVKYSLSEGGFYFREQKRMTDAKSQNETWLNYNIQALPDSSLVHFIRPTFCSKRQAGIFLSKIFINIWQHICRLLCILPSIN